MNENSLQTSFWTMILVQTMGSIDMPGSGPRKMPAPRQYVAILLTWLVLQLIAGINASAQRATAALGWLLVLTGLVIGPFGKQVINLFTIVGQRWGNFPASPTASSGVGGQSIATLEGNAQAAG
jgi:flagellar biosynthesis protein FliR